nr:hypothetical protein [Tumebacillus algifaecis]
MLVLKPRHPFRIHGESRKVSLNLHAEETTVSGPGHPMINFQFGIFVLNIRAAPLSHLKQRSLLIFHLLFMMLRDQTNGIGAFF